MSGEFEFSHTPVLLEACIESLAIQADGTYLDGTCGGAGHSSEILNRLDDRGLLIALDRDRMALEASEERLEAVKKKNGRGRYIMVHSEFASVGRVLRERNIRGLDGVLLDLGVSSAQLDIRERGFSYSADGPLDMRMNRDSGKTAADWVNEESEDELRRIFFEYGEERYAARIAAAICRRRAEKPFTQTVDLAELIIRTMPASSRREKQHPAKRCFQALRIAVNEELKQVEEFLEQIPDLMNDKGRICIISFHSLEDRMVKQAMRSWEQSCTCPKEWPLCQCGHKPLGQRIARHGITAGAEEEKNNPRSRSARLRVFEINRQ